MFTIQTMATDKTIKAVQRKILAKIAPMQVGEVGEGFFGKTFAHATNPKLVVKVSMADGRLGGDQASNPLERDGYLNWLRAMSTRTSRFFPSVKSATIIANPRTKQGLSVVTMERLTPITWKTPAKAKTAAAHAIAPSLPAIISLESALVRSVLMSSDNSDTVQLAAALEQAFQWGRADIHEGNWMFRGDCPVITDPVA